MLVSSLIYFIAYVYTGKHDNAWHLLSLEFWLRNLVILLSVYFGKFEIYQISENGLAYFGDLFNYFNSTQIVLNILICMSFGYKWNIFSAETIYLLMAVSIFSGFINCFYWMRFFESTSRYVKMIIDSIGQIRDFILV